MNKKECEILNGIKLTDEESELFAELQKWEIEIDSYEKKWIASFCEAANKNLSKAQENGGKLAFSLHRKLSSRGVQVKYGRWLKHRVESLKFGPERLEFHQDTWPVKDLISFVKCKNIHDEIGDVTLGVPFQFKIFTAHRTQPDCEYWAVLSLSRNSGGWKTQYWEKVTENDDKQCSALLSYMRQVDHVNPPQGIGEIFERLWEKAAEGYLAQGDLAFKLADLMNWISATERAKPKWY